MRLVIEIQAVADELFELDLGRAFEAALAAGAAATLATVSTLPAFAAISTGAIAARAAVTTASATFSGGTALLALFLLFCHV
jgi:hypothetical protein